MLYLLNSAKRQQLSYIPGELGAKALKTFNQDIYFVVDGVSCIGAVDVNLERDYIDVLVSGSQKQLCCHLV